MEKSVLLMLVLLAFVAFNEASPISNTNEERSRMLQQLTRERREVDYYDWRQYLPKKCSNCNILSIGNGYKNKNTVTFNGPVPEGWKFSK